MIKRTHHQNMGMQARRHPPPRAGATDAWPKENRPSFAIQATSSRSGQQEERQLLQQAKNEHRDTTAAAQRALRVVNDTLHVAQGTLDSLYQQGQQLDRAAHGVEQIGEEVKHAGRILAFMRRCFCFRTAGADPDLHLETRRRSVVQQQRMAAVLAAQGTADAYAAKRQLVGAAMAQLSAASPSKSSAAAAAAVARDSLIPAAHGPGPFSAAAAAAAAATGLGYGLHPLDRRDIDRETERQEECLDEIGAALGALQAMGLAMGQELVEQVPKVDALQRQAEDTGVALRGVAGGAAKLAGGAPRGRAPDGASWQADQAAAGVAVARALQASGPVARRYYGVR